MKKFVAIYMGSKSSKQMIEWNELTQEQMAEKEKAGLEAWKNWALEHKKSIIEQGSPLGKTKLINSDGISNTINQMVAYTIVEANSHEEAAKLFVNHPHFTIFPGESVEIMECLPLPK